MPVNVTEEEIQAELEAMQQAGRHHIPTKRIDNKVNSHKRTKVILIFTLLVSVLLCAFVLLSKISGEIKTDGYIIQIDDKEYQSNLKLAFDPTFDEKYMNLIGLGYGDVSSITGGSLLKNLEMNTTMFAKFKNFAEHQDQASQYEGNQGSANFDQYYCNKYYLKNIGEETEYYRLNIEITDNINNALDAARFMIVTEITKADGTIAYDYQIFATPNKTTGESEYAATKEKKTGLDIITLYFTDPNTSDTCESENERDAWKCDDLVKDDKTGFYHYYSCTRSENGEILDGQMYKLEPDDSVCYTICMWFEGSDDDHNNSILGGSITFSINYETEGYLKARYFENKQNN